jgi:hypothetical protein
VAKRPRRHCDAHNNEFNHLNANLLVLAKREFISNAATGGCIQAEHRLCGVAPEGGYDHDEIVTHWSRSLCGVGSIRWKRQCGQNARPQDPQGNDHIDHIDDFDYVVGDGEGWPPS